MGPPFGITVQGLQPSKLNSLEADCVVQWLGDWVLISSDTVTYNLFIRKLCLIAIVLSPQQCFLLIHYRLTRWEGMADKLKGICSGGCCLVTILTLIRLWCEVTGEQEVAVGVEGAGAQRRNASENGFLEPWGRRGASTQCTQQGNINQQITDHQGTGSCCLCWFRKGGGYQQQMLHCRYLKPKKHPQETTCCWPCKLCVQHSTHECCMFTLHPFTRIHPPAYRCIF